MGAAAGVSFVLAIIIVAPPMSYAQFGGFPFFPTSQEVLPTYISRIIPGAASEDSLFHYYPPDIAVPAGTTIAWFNDDPGQPHTVTSGIPIENSGSLFNSGVMPYESFFQYTFDEAGIFDYYCTIHPWRIGTVSVSDAVERGNYFEFRSGTGPRLDLTQNNNNNTLLVFKPITITPQETTPITYNVSLLAPDRQQEIFSESFFALGNDLQVELINDPTMNRTATYGPDVSDPITGAYHVKGNLFETTGEYTIRVEVIAIGNNLPNERTVDEFRMQVMVS
jgi:plastocyanin